MRSDGRWFAMVCDVVCVFIFHLWFYTYRKECHLQLKQDRRDVTASRKSSIASRDQVTSITTKSSLAFVVGSAVMVCGGV